MAVIKGYKMTEIGEIPEDWEVTTFENVAPLQRGYDLPQNQIEAGRYPVVFSNGILCYNNHFKMNAPGVVTGRSGTIGSVFYIDENYWPHNTTLYVTDFKVNHPKFIYYLYLFNKIGKFASGSGVPTLNRNEVHPQKVILPPFEEQIKIANIISDIDSLISSLEQLIAKKCLIKQGAMRELLTGKKRLAGFDGEWKNTTLGKIAIVKDGTHQTPKYVDIGIPFFSVENITNNNFKNNLKYISPEDHQQLSKNIKLRENDILMTRIGVLGKCKLIDWTCEASFYVSLALIRVTNEEVSPHFLFHLLNSQATSQCIDALALPNAIPPKINLGPISSITISFPLIEEQAAIASVLSDIDEEIAALEAKLEKTRQIKSGMMEELLTGRIRLV